MSDGRRAIRGNHSHTRLLSVLVCILLLATLAAPLSANSSVEPIAESMNNSNRPQSMDVNIIGKYSGVNAFGFASVKDPGRNSGSRASAESYIFYDDFETGTDGWTIADSDSNSGSDYWAATTNRPCYDNYSLYCAGVGGLTGQTHTIFYDTAEYIDQRDAWVTGDYSGTSGTDYWGGSTTRAGTGSYSYYCSALAGVSSITDGEAGQNLADVPIPDSGGGWVYSAITINSAPTGAVVTNLEVHILVPHSYVSDLAIDLEDGNVGDALYQRLWNYQGTNVDQGLDDDTENDADIDLTRAYSTFNGQPVNQQWSLWAWDGYSGDTGYINEWWIRINYTNPSQHYDNSMDAYMKQVIDLTGHTGCSLSFNYWLDLEDSNDFACVKASTTNYADPNNAGWTTLLNKSSGYDSNDVDDALDSLWTASGAISLGAFDGQYVYVMFSFHSDSATVREGWYVDEIKITGTGKSYDTYMNSYAEVTVNLVGYTNAYVSFVFWMDAEDYYDYFNISVNEGTGWRDLMVLNEGADQYQYDGNDPDVYARIWWQTVHLDITSECGYPSVKIRMTFVSDLSDTREGIYIDEFEVASVFFFDEMETGTNGWTSTHTTQPNWHLVSTEYYSPTNAWWCGNDTTGQYANGMDEYLTHSFDLTFAEDATLQFLFTGKMEQDYDFLFIGISVDNGASWDYYGGLTGDYSDWWYYAQIDLSGYTRHTALVTFDFYSDKEVTDIGVWIDDVNIFGTIDKTAPSQVQGLTVTALPEGRKLSLQWTANTEFDVAGYKIYRSLTSGSGYAQIGTSTINSFVDQDLTDGTRYYYKVSAFDIAGNEGPQSAEASGIPLDSMPPASIQEVYATDMYTGGSVNVSWLPGTEPDIAGYKVYYSTSNFNNVTLATYYPGSPTSNQSASWCHVIGPTNDIQYYFGVTAIDRSGNENKTVVKTAYATPTDTTPPVVRIDSPEEGTTHRSIVNIVVDAQDDGGIRDVYVTIDKGVPNACVHTAFGWEFDWNSTGVADGTHSIDANATDNENNIGYAASVNITTDNTAPSPPTNLAIALSSNNIVLTWGASVSPDFNHYAIYRSQTPTMNYVAPYATTTSLTWTDTGAGDNSWQNYFYVVRAVDNIGNQDVNEVRVGKFVKQMSGGWCLVSTPLVQQNTNISSVLLTLPWNYTQFYNATDSDHWKTNMQSRPDSQDDLWSITHLLSVWVNIYAPGGDYLITVGRMPQWTNISLKAGWNLVGYPCFTNKTVATVSGELPNLQQVEAFNATSPYRLSVLNSGDLMSAGNGYWIKVSSDCVWTITN